MVCNVPWAPANSTCGDIPFINGYMGEVEKSFHEQTNKGIPSILSIQHPKGVPPWVDGWTMWHFYPLLWMVYDEPWAPTIHTGVNTHPNSSMGDGRGWYTIVQATKKGDNVHTGHTTPQICALVNGWKLWHFYPLPSIVCEVPWAQITHTYIYIQLKTEIL